MSAVDTPVLLLVNETPRTVSEIYRDWRGFDATARLTFANKTERRKLAAELERLASLDEIKVQVELRDTPAGAREFVVFWRPSGL